MTQPELDFVALHERTKKQELEACKDLIVAEMKRWNTLWPDQVIFPRLTHHNVIGSAWKVLQKKGFIEKTGRFRRSISKASNGRTIFEYRRKI